MIAIDTNIIIRLLTQDDLPQYKKAHGLFKDGMIYISLTVIQETEWVLRYAYEFTSEDINKALKGLLGLDNIEVEAPLALSQALSMHSSGMDFSDALHLAQSHKCTTFYTFDKKLIKKSIGNGICNTCEP